MLNKWHLFLLFYPSIQKFIALTGNVNLKLFVQLHYVSELTLIPEDQEYHSRVRLKWNADSLKMGLERP